MTEGIPHSISQVYVKYFCMLPIMIMEAITSSVDVDVEKFGIIHSLKLGSMTFSWMRPDISLANSAKSTSYLEPFL